MNILITGATGLIGRQLGRTLAMRGHKIFIISRDQKKALCQIPFPAEVITGDLNKGLIQDPRLGEIQGVIHLAGEPIIGERWTDEQKNNIKISRVLGTRHLIQSLKSSKVEVFISGSAIGFYGDRKDEICLESHEGGGDFLAHVCRDWEMEALQGPGRVVILRTGVVLSSMGGALQKMLFPFKAGVGGVVGCGKQWMSWIHVDDFIGMCLHALFDNKVEGIYNAVAPHPVTNKEFSVRLAKSLGRPLALPVPEVVVKALFGEAAVAILSSTRVSSEKIEKSGFKFQFRDLHQALWEFGEDFRNGEEVFYAEQFIPAPPAKVFDFFKEPHNLEKITPDTLNFNLKTCSTEVIQQGTLIDYQLKIHGVPVKWRTLIEEWVPPFRFVDTQLKGPYFLWHHTHEFQPFCGGTLMTDRVRYRLPLGYLGWIAAGYFVRKDVEDIFKYRRKVIGELVAQGKF